MRMLTFANRNTKEILRDPINLFFGLSPKSVLFTFPFPIREVRFHPFDFIHFSVSDSGSTLPSIRHTPPV